MEKSLGSIHESPVIEESKGRSFKDTAKRVAGIVVAGALSLGIANDVTASGDGDIDKALNNNPNGVVIPNNSSTGYGIFESGDRIFELTLGDEKNVIGIDDSGGRKEDPEDPSSSKKDRKKKGSEGDTKNPLLMSFIEPIQKAGNNLVNSLEEAVKQVDRPEGIETGGYQFEIPKGLEFIGVENDIEKIQLWSASYDGTTLYFRWNEDLKSEIYAVNLVFQDQLNPGEYPAENIFTAGFDGRLPSESNSHGLAGVSSLVLRGIEVTDFTGNINYFEKEEEVGTVAYASGGTVSRVLRFRASSS